jgi:hypothetical protein
MKRVYGILCIFGTVLPYWPFLLWISENGLQINRFITEAASIRISAFAWLDVLIAAIVLISFILYEGKHLQMSRLWLPVCSTLAVGVSLGRPLFLLLREIHLEQEKVNPDN